MADTFWALNPDLASPARSRDSTPSPSRAASPMRMPGQSRSSSPRRRPRDVTVAFTNPFEAAIQAAADQAADKV